jgi:hypothetical protein
MTKPDDCPNSPRIDDMLNRCRDQHSEINILLREIRNELTMIRESVAERMKSHTQRIKILDRDMLDLRRDVDTRFDVLGKDMRNLNNRFLKVAGAIGIVLIGVQKALPPLEWWSNAILP